MKVYNAEQFRSAKHIQVANFPIGHMKTNIHLGEAGTIIVHLHTSICIIKHKKSFKILVGCRIIFHFVWYAKNI